MSYPVITDAPNVEAGRARYICTAGYGGNGGVGTWLQFFYSNPSDASPLIFSEASTIRAFSVSMKTDTTVTFGLYVNGSLIDTLVITAAKTGVKADIEHIVYVEDELSIKVESGSARDILFFTHVRVDI